MTDNTELIFKPSIREDTKAQQDVRAWIAALRSGKYEQCTGYLHRRGDGFCCLGVQLNLVNHNKWRVLSNVSDVMVWRGEAKTTLPADVYSAMHLRDDIGSFHNPERSPIDPASGVMFNDSLTRLNDEHFSFAKIADKIEHDLEAVLAG